MKQVREKKLARVAIVRRSGSRDHLLERDGELVGAERTALAHFRAKCGDLVPGLQGALPWVVMGIGANNGVHRSAVIGVWSTAGLGADLGD